MFRLTCDSHIPVKPPHKKKKKKLVKNKKIVSIRKKPFNNVSVQFIILTIAGNAIITVIVLYKDLLR